MNNYRDRNLVLPHSGWMYFSWKTFWLVKILRLCWEGKQHGVWCWLWHQGRMFWLRVVSLVWPCVSWC